MPYVSIPHPSSKVEVWEDGYLIISSGPDFIAELNLLSLVSKVKYIPF